MDATLEPTSLLSNIKHRAEIHTTRRPTIGRSAERDNHSRIRRTPALDYRLIRPDHHALDFRVDAGLRCRWLPPDRFPEKKEDRKEKPDATLDESEPQRPLSARQAPGLDTHRQRSEGGDEDGPDEKPRRQRHQEPR
ncbi:MAG: hypothetical protein ABIZ56_08340, partial [Chthoniobacteraceae bacterium]